MQAEILVPPGPGGLPVVGSIAALFRDPLGFHQRLCRDYHGVVRVKVPGSAVYALTDPQLVETLLVGKHRECVKDLMTHELRPLVGRGMLTSDGDAWRRQRKLAAQHFAPRSMEQYADIMVADAREAFASYEEGELRDFHHDIMALTLKIVGKTLLGVDTEAETKRVAEALDSVIPYMEQRLFGFRGLLPASIPWASTRRFRRAKRDLDDLVSTIIRRAQRLQEGDFLLARLIRARDESGSGMSDQVLADEAITMLLAGHETTALAVMFAVHSIATHPAVAALLRAELDEHVGERPLCYADAGRLPVLEAVVKETLRLYPPAPLVGRELAVPIEIGGYDLDRGVQIYMSPFAIQRDPRHYPEPDAFNPDRFLDGSTASLPKFAYFPFGGGPRVCIGQYFAMMEAKLILATLLQQVELIVQPGFKLELQPVVTLRSRYGLPVRVRRRRPGESVGPRWSRPSAAE